MYVWNTFLCHHVEAL